MKSHLRSAPVSILYFFIATLLAGPVPKAAAQSPEMPSPLSEHSASRARHEAFAGFESLSLEGKKALFSTVGAEEKKALFQKLTDQEKKTVFGMLDRAEQEALFAVLSDADKVLLFEAMSDSQKKLWREKIPSLGMVIGKRETLPPSRLERPEPKKEELPSRIEKVLSGQFPEGISRQLHQYGYDFFDTKVSTFTPVTNVPVGADYVIGPGDNFTVHLWGKVEKSYEVMVNRDGCVTIPRLGTLNVSGLTFAELKRFLCRKFKEFYPDFELSITMGRLRTIDVFIVGEARHPGTYSVSSLSTVITALYSAGGPSKNGSLRRVKLFRAGKLFATLDLYEFFIKGVKANDIRLQTGDTIFIPVIGPVVGVAGSVRRPAIYELKGGESAGAAIGLAGGVLPFGHLHNVVIERIEGHRRRIVKSFNLERPSGPLSGSGLDIPLKDGDVIKIYPVYKRLRQVVYLEGHVKYPREYELKPGMRLRDIISSYDDLLSEPYLPLAEIVRLMPPDLHPEIIEFNLGALLEGDETQNLPLQDLDRIIVYHRWEKREMPLVTIKGEVRRPGAYRLYEGMTLSDLIFRAGNLTHKAYQDEAVLTRMVAGKTRSDIVKIKFSLRKAMTGDPAHNLKLQEDDVIYIREIPEYSDSLKRRVYLEGEFRFPGEYTYSKGERLSSLIERAGGLTEEAYPFGAIFERESVRKIQARRIKEYIDQLEKDILTMSALSAETAVEKEQAAILRESLSAKKQLIQKLRAAKPTGRMVIDLREVLLLPTSEYNFELRPGDRLIVNKRPDSVNVLGEVYNPTALFCEKNKSIAYYLDKVGGPTENANEDQIYLVKADGTVLSKKQGGFFGLASWDTREHRWAVGSFDSIIVDPGDTIIVPRKVEKYPWLRITKDITQIVYQIAVAAGVLVVAY